MSNQPDRRSKRQSDRRSDHPGKESLWRYARHYYLSHYRNGYDHTGVRTHLAACVVAVLLLVYGGSELCRYRVQGDNLGTIVTGLPCVILIAMGMYAVKSVHELTRQAKKFADRAVLVSVDRQGIESYFDELYPWLYFGQDRH